MNIWHDRDEYLVEKSANKRCFFVVRYLPSQNTIRSHTWTKKRSA
jgi:hypothetical protein